MEFFVALTQPDTPELPSAGFGLAAFHAGTLSGVTLALNSGLTRLRKVLKLKLVPELSERTQAVIAAFGSFTPGLALAMAGSLQRFSVPAKILPIVRPSRRSGFFTP